MWSKTIFYFYFFIVFFIIAQYNYDSALYNSTLFFFTNYLNSVLKLAYADTRPYFINSDLKYYKWTSECDYGKPSGHSMLTAVIMIIIHNYVTKLFSMKKFVYVVFWLFLFLNWVMVSLSRMYLGNHSFNQLVLGLLFVILLHKIMQIYWKSIYNKIYFKKGKYI